MNTKLVIAVFWVAAGCSKSAPIAPEPRTKSQLTPSALTPSALASAPLAPLAPTVTQVGQESAPVVIVAPEFASVDALLHGASSQSAFDALALLGGRLKACGVPTEVFCYEALADYTLIQMTAGDVESARCTASVAPAQKASWETRLAAARTSAGQRQEAILTRAIATGCGKALGTSSGPVGGCATCVKAGAFADSMLHDQKMQAASKPALDEARDELSKPHVPTTAVSPKE